jgi:hypothetical protein
MRMQLGNCNVHGAHGAPWRAMAAARARRGLVN